MADVIPHVTHDRTEGLHFSRPFAIKEIEWVKLHIRKHPSNSALGFDHVSYKDISGIPKEDLLHLFQMCVDSGDAPSVWLITYIIGILKVGKEASNPESYHPIGLESCLLKTPTLLIAKQFKTG